MSQALTGQDFARALAPFALPRRLAVAVSGGPDSMALAWGTRAAGYEVTALIVEHGLRPESPQEALEVRARLAALGITALILPWRHEAVTSRIHVRARAARRALMLEACRAHGLEALLFAHHASDQAETILMRFAKGSGLAGLAGMDAQSQAGGGAEGVRFVRPLLAFAKDELIETCKAQKIAFVTDPSNGSDHYARGRLRAAWPVLAREGLTQERLLDLGARAREAAEALDFYAKSFLREKAVSTAAGAVRLSLDGFDALPRAVRFRVLTLILMTLHRGAPPPSRAGLEQLLATLEGAGAGGGFYGCLLQKGEGRVLFLREPAAAARSVSVLAGDRILWDGRWLLAGAEGLEGEIRALAAQPKALWQALSPDLKRLAAGGRVRAGLPALFRQGQLVAIPDFSPQAQTGFRASFLPPLWL